MSRPFIILSQMRCGTHFLRSLLNSHPAIECFDEIFSPFHPHQLLQGLPRSVSSRKLIHAAWKHHQGKCLGFIVHDHQDASNSSHGWDHEVITSLDPKPLLIWLSRENCLAQYASQKIAESSGNWFSSGHAQKNPRKLRPDPKQLSDWILSTSLRRSKLKIQLSGFDSISLTYEELCRKPQESCNQIFSRLAISPTMVNSPKSKYRGYRIPQIFDNFEEIVEELSKRSFDSNDSM